MTSERVRRLRSRAEEQTEETMRRLHESGEISHLYGKPLDLRNDPEWLATQVLKQQGFTHPLLERARDLEEPQRAADLVLERLTRRRSWLANPASRATLEDIEAFNAQRTRALDEYRDKLHRLNRAISDYNLVVPEAIQRRPVLVDSAVERAALEIPALAPPEIPVKRRSRHLFRRRVS